jgi:hypothetical protein
MVKLPSDRHLPAVCTIIALVAALTVGVSPGRAADVNARGSVTGKGLINTDVGASVVDARVDFEVDVDAFTFGGAYRAYSLGDPDYNPAGIDPVYGLKHRYVEGNVQNLFFRAGHYFSTFGRGLTLRSVEDIALEHDTALDGFLAEYDAGPVMVTALAGAMAEDQDLEALEHTVRGVRVKAAGGETFSVALSCLDRDTDIRDMQGALPGSPVRYPDNLLGADVEVWLGPVSMVAEHARRDGAYYPDRQQGDLDGSGTYLSGTLTGPWLTLLGEYKDYDKFANALVSPPICVKEHIWTLMNRVTHQVDLGNERGFLVEGTLSAGENMQITGGASEARTQGGGLTHWEMFGQVDQPLPRWCVTSLAGSWSRGEYSEGKFEDYKSAGLDLEIPVGADLAVDISMEAQTVTRRSEESHRNYLGSVAVYPWPSVTLAAAGEVTTEQDLERDAWAFGEARVSVGGGLEVSLGGGTERGGKKCSGGICYDEPEFSGVRLRFSAFF